MSRLFTLILTSGLFLNHAFGDEVVSVDPFMVSVTSEEVKVERAVLSLNCQGDAKSLGDSEYKELTVKSSGKIYNISLDSQSDLRIPSGSRCWVSFLAFTTHDEYLVRADAEIYGIDFESTQLKTLNLAQAVTKRMNDSRLVASPSFENIDLTFTYSDLSTPSACLNLFNYRYVSREGTTFIFDEMRTFQGDFTGRLQMTDGNAEMVYFSCDSQRRILQMKSYKAQFSEDWKTMTIGNQEWVAQSK